MLHLIKILVSFSLIISISYFAASYVDDLFNGKSSLEGMAELRPEFEGDSDLREEAFGAERLDKIENVSVSSEVLEFSNQIDVLIEYGSDLEALVEFGKFIDGYGTEVLEEIFIGLLGRDFEERRVWDMARLTLESIASENPAIGVELLHSVAPAEKLRLATALASGWTMRDPVAAWEWIEFAWIDQGGEFIDRELQNEMFRSSLDTALRELKDYRLAASLTSSMLEPELKDELAAIIARRVVSDNPSQALNKLNFDGDETIDMAVMNAIVDAWAQRDVLGAQAWVQDNEDQVSTAGTRDIAKNLVLSNARENLREFHGTLLSAEKKDTVASEAARLFARRELLESIDWLRAIQSPIRKDLTVQDALYELGHDDFDSTISYVDLAYDRAELQRLPTLMEALSSWARVDQTLVRDYLSSERSGLSQLERDMAWETIKETL